MTTTTEPAAELRAPTLRLVGRIIDTFHQPFQSDFQNDRFVLGMNGVTLWGCFRQALREVHSRIEAMRSEYIDLSDAVAQVASATDKATKVGNIRGNERARERVKKAATHFDAARASIKRASMDERMRDREREFAHLVNRLLSIYEALVNEHGEDLDAEQLEREFWVAKLTREALAEKAVHGAISKGTLDCILNLPNDLLAQVLAAVPFERSPKEALEKLIGFPLVDVASLPAPDGLQALTGSDVRQFLTGSPGPATAALAATEGAG